MVVLKIIFRIILVLAILLIIGFAGIITYALISNYKPEPTEILSVSNKPDMLSDSAVLSLLTWNIGYCGLDREMDFFYDGGTKVITPKNNFIKNLTAVKDFFRENENNDFILIQEIDENSKRSYHFNEYDTISHTMVGFFPFFAKNYDVVFVPVPPSNPMGKVLSGIATFSKYRPSSSTRFSFPGEYGFPKQLFMLDRCFMVNRYSLADGRELLIINTHNEAFDPGEIRKAQMAFLKEFLFSEYAKGNYIIAGGDWNQSPPGFQPEFGNNKVNTDQMMMNSDYLPPEWKWVYDNKIPSNRSVTASYDPSSTTTTVIDLFLLSPNVRLESVQCINLEFENSDHNPVKIKVKLQKQNF